MAGEFPGRGIGRQASTQYVDQFGVETQTANLVGIRNRLLQQLKELLAG